MLKSDSALGRMAVGVLLLGFISGCAAPPAAAPIESTEAATEAPVPASEQTERARHTVTPGGEALPVEGTPEGYPTEVIQAVLGDPLVVSLLAGLGQQGLPPQLLDASRVELLGDAPGQGYRLGEGWLHVHVYPDAQAAGDAAARILGEMANSIMDWVAPPHFYRCDYVIVLYLGTDPAAMNALNGLCQPPFYTTELPSASGPEPLADYASVSGVELTRRAQEAGLWHTDLHGGEYAALGADKEVYVVDWTSGEKTQVTSDGLEKGEAVLSENYVAWTAYTTVDDQGLPLVDIYVLDRRTGAQRLITEQPAPRTQLTLAGDRLAWADRHNELDGHYMAYDVYAYDLAASTELAVAVAPGAQYQPSLSGDRLVWVDNRDSAHRDGNLAGCGNCPENRFDLYLYDFGSQATRVLVSGEALRSEPSNAGNRVAWIEYGEIEARLNAGLAIGASEVYWLDLETDVVQRLTTTPQSESGLTLAGDRLVWTVRNACDVVTIVVDATPAPAHTGVYVFDLVSGEAGRLTDYVEPRVFFEGEAALIVEGCMTGHEAYVVEVAP